ncbi:MAG: type II secretion system protein GspL [Deltaproteobacteria bacterium]|nr:type II secretion system protein GspL [Deltaproteobacteria bacterium]
MALPILIIDIGMDSIKAGVFSSRIEPLDFFIEPISAKGHAHSSELKEAASALFQKIRGKYGGFEKILLSLPASELSVRVIGLPFEDRKKIKDILPFELSGLLHLDIEELTVDGMPLGGGKVLAVAVEKKALREYLAIMDGLGADPFWAGSALFAVPVLLDELYGGKGVKAFISKDSLIVAEDGKMKFFKPVKRFEGVKLGLAYLGAEDIRVQEAYISGWDIKELKALMPEAGKVEGLDLRGYPEEGSTILALSLQLKKGLLAGNINLRSGEFEYTKERLRGRKSLRLTAIAAGVIIMILAGDLYIRYLGLSAELLSYREALRASYTQLFPGEKATGDEEYQLEAKLSALSKEEAVIGGGVSPLKVMESFSKAAAAGNRIILSEIFIGEGRVKAKGEADSFEGANRFREALSKDPLLKDVSLSDVKSKAGGGAFFSVSAGLK